MINSTYNFFRRFITGVRRYMAVADNRILLLFAVEGLLITLVNNLVGSYNNLFATRLGASDYELSLVITLPQLVGMLVLIPGGILTDRMPNKRKMVILSLGLISGVYFLIGLTPMLGNVRLLAFLILLSISTAPMTVYNVSWQAYFSDVVVKDEDRNSVLTVRNRINFLIGILIPLGCGAILASAKTIGLKLRWHQIYIWLACFLLILQMFVLKKIQSRHNSAAMGIRFKEIKSALTELGRNKKFLGYVCVALFFYMTWHIDWTLYFLGQVNYLGMNEAWLGYTNIGNAIIQFTTLGFWSRLNMKKGIRFSIMFGGLGLVTFPITMIIATGMPGSYAKLAFVIMNAASSAAFATVSLNMQLLLLEVLPEKNKTLNISLYTILIMLSNAFMPLAGVALYTFMGADLAAYQKVYWFIFVIRIVSASLWIFRWWFTRRETEK